MKKLFMVVVVVIIAIVLALILESPVKYDPTRQSPSQCVIQANGDNTCRY